MNFDYEPISEGFMLVIHPKTSGRAVVVTGGEIVEAFRHAQQRVSTSAYVGGVLVRVFRGTDTLFRVTLDDQHPRMYNSRDRGFLIGQLWRDQSA